MGDLSNWAAGVIRKRAKGHTTTLRRSNTLRPSTIKISVDALAGATGLSLVASSGKLIGSVVSGAQFTISGILSTTFTILEDADTLNSGTLVVGISPALPVHVPAATPITFTQTYADVIYPVLIRKISDEDEKEGRNGQSIRLLPFQDSKPAPRVNDRLNGIPIIRVDEISGDGDHLAYYRCEIDEGTSA